MLRLGRKLLFLAGITALFVSVPPFIGQAENEESTLGYGITWSLEEDTVVHGTNQFNLNAGSIVSFDVAWPDSIEEEVVVGLYNQETETYYWPFGSSDLSLNGAIVAPESGLYSFAVGNPNEDEEIEVVGDYEF